MIIADIRIYSKARFKRCISHVPNTIHELSAWKVQCLKQLNSADLNCMQLALNIRQRQSNIQQKFNWCFNHQIFHCTPNKMHYLCLFTWSCQINFFCTVDSNAMCRKSWQALCDMTSWHPSCFGRLMVGANHGIYNIHVIIFPVNSMFELYRHFPCLLKWKHVSVDLKSQYKSLSYFSVSKVTFWSLVNRWNT